MPDALIGASINPTGKATTYNNGFQADMNLAEANVGPVHAEVGLSASTGVYEENGVSHAKLLGTGVEVGEGYFGVSVLGTTFGFGNKRREEEKRERQRREERIQRERKHEEELKRREERERERQREEERKQREREHEEEFKRILEEFKRREEEREQREREQEELKRIVEELKRREEKECERQREEERKQREREHEEELKRRERQHKKELKEREEERKQREREHEELKRREQQNKKELEQREEEHKQREREHKEELKQREEEHKQREKEHKEELKQREEERKQREREHEELKRRERQNKKELEQREEEHKQREREHKEELKRRQQQFKQREQQLEEEVDKYKSADFEKWTILKNDDSMSSLLCKIGGKYPGSEMEKLRAYAREEFGIDPNKFNLAITGQSGVGKSTLINALRGYGDYDPKAAKIGITECTQKVKGYPHPVVKHLVLHDMPGAGTREHPVGTYFCDKGLYAVDFMLVVMTRRTFHCDLTLAQLAQQRRIPVIFVRNQTKNDFETMQNNPEYENMEEKELIKLMISIIKESIKNDFLNSEIPGIENLKVFLIESHSLRQRKNMKFEELDLLDHLSKLQHPRSDLSLEGLIE